MRGRTVAALAMLALVARSGRAEDAPAPRLPYRITGAVSAGYRLVDVDGSGDRYDEDYNLHSGGRLFLFSVAGEAHDPAAVPVDRFHLEVDTPGDEPVSRFVLTAEERKLWDLRVDFTRSKYFYDQPQLFRAPVPGNLRLADLHAFDLTRTNGIAQLRVHPEGWPTLIAGYRLYQREGSGTSTVTVPGGGLFVTRAPQRQVTHVGSLGTEFTALGTNVFLEQEYRYVTRDYGLHGPRDPDGVDPNDGFTLSSWQSTADDHIQIPITRLRVRRPVGDRLTLTGGYVYAHANLDYDRTRYRDGTSTIPADDGPSTRIDASSASLDTQLVDLGASYRLARMATLRLTYRYDDREQDGDLDALLDPGRLETETDYHVRLHRVTSDVELRPVKALAVRAGVQWARRDAAFSIADQSVSTDVVGAVAEARWKPWRWLDGYLRYDHVTIDDPWTIPGDAPGAPAVPSREIAYTFDNRGAAGLRARPRDWVQLAYDFTADSFENADFQGRVQRFASTVSVSLTPLPGLTAFAGYTRRDLDTSNLIYIAPRYRPQSSLQRGSEDVITSTLQYDFTLFAHGWSTGWNVVWVDSNDTLAPSFEPGLPANERWDVSRIDAGMFLTFRHPIVEPGIEVRHVTFSEPSRPRNDYEATIVTFRLTRRFDF